MIFDPNKNYWLFIEPHTYFCIKDARALLYHTKTGESMEVAIPEIICLLQSLHEKKNLGTIYCEGKQLLKEPYCNFVVEFCNKKMGNVVDTDEQPQKPIQLMPILNLQRDIDKIQINEGLSIGEEVLHYLQVVNIYLHTACSRNCSFCDYYFQQNLCCRKTGTTLTEFLDVSILRSFLCQIRCGAVGVLNLLGGDITKYPFYNELPTLLADFRERVHIWNHYTNIKSCETLFPDFQYDIPVTFPLDSEKWERCVTLIKDVKVKFHFYITNEEEYKIAIALIKNIVVKSYVILPIYTKANLDFFKEYVYVNKEDVLKTILPFRRIFAHQKLNTISFGVLNVFPNGDVYANVNSSTIGNITTDSLLTIINNELHINTAWRKIRDTKPCLDCLLQYICASPSNYELAIGKSNLCLERI